MLHNHTRTQICFFVFILCKKKNQREGGTKGALSKKDRAALDGEEFHNSREHEGHEQKEANWRSKQNNSRSNSHAAAESLQPRRLRHAALGPRKPAQPPPAPLPLLVNCCGCSLAEGEKRSQKTQEHTAAPLCSPRSTLTHSTTPRRACGARGRRGPTCHRRERAPGGRPGELRRSRADRQRGEERGGIVWLRGHAGGWWPGVT